MRYALLIHYPQPAVSTLTEDELKAGMAAFHAYAKAIDDAGVLVSAEILQTIASATSVSVKQGKLQVQDGPRRHQGGVRRHLHTRRSRPRRCARLGGEVPRGTVGHGGDPPLGGPLRRRRVEERAVKQFRPSLRPPSRGAESLTA